MACLRATNVLTPGRAQGGIVGYGWCGRGVALRAKGLGSDVIVTENQPHESAGSDYGRASVMPMTEAAKVARRIITLTGNKNVIAGRISAR